MSIELKRIESAAGVYIEATQEIISQNVKQITAEMVKALMLGLQEKLNFKELAEKHISITHKNDLSASDATIQMVYQKLFMATNEHIQKHSQPLVMTFAMMNQQTGNPEAAGMFLGTFILPTVHSIVEKLKADYPEALDDKRIWG